MIQHRVVRGLHVVLDVEVGIGGLVLPEASTDALDPFPASSLSMHEDAVTGALRDLQGLGVLPWMVGLDWAYLDPEEKALALRFDGVREDVDDGTLDEAGNAVLDALRPWMY